MKEKISLLEKEKIKKEEECKVNEDDSEKKTITDLKESTYFNERTGGFKKEILENNNFYSFFDKIKSIKSINNLIDLVQGSELNSMSDSKSKDVIFDCINSLINLIEDIIIETNNSWLNLKLNLDFTKTLNKESYIMSNKEKTLLPQIIKDFEKIQKEFEVKINTELRECKNKEKNTNEKEVNENKNEIKNLKLKIDNLNNELANKNLELDKLKQKNHELVQSFKKNQNIKELEKEIEKNNDINNKNIFTTNVNNLNVNINSNENEGEKVKRLLKILEESKLHLYYY